MKQIYCCGCGMHVDARLTNGAEVYAHRSDLHQLPFWKCDSCGNFVGCHHKSDEPTRPLGCIPTPEIKNARRHLHALIDPLWQKGLIKRSALYSKLSDATGRRYHTANIRSIEEARDVYRIAQGIAKELKQLEKTA